MREPSYVCKPWQQRALAIAKNGVRLGGRGGIQYAAGWVELHTRGYQREWEPYSRLALALLAQAVQDAMGASPRDNRPKGDILRDREDAILLLRSMDGGYYLDRLMWLEIAHPRSDSKAMDRLLQSRLDARGLPRV